MFLPYGDDSLVFGVCGSRTSPVKEIVIAWLRVANVESGIISLGLSFPNAPFGRKNNLSDLSLNDYK